MALDEPGKTDEIHTADGFTFVMDKDTAGIAGDVTIDASRWGIELRSGLNKGRSKNSCSL
jgi:Fe-S cluster assembly iron-binding protein IscA